MPLKSQFTQASLMVVCLVKPMQPTISCLRWTGSMAADERADLLQKIGTCEDSTSGGLLASATVAQQVRGAQSEHRGVEPQIEQE